MTTYSFSLDHAVWSGSFPSRQAAVAAGLAHAREVDTPPESLYVAQRITPNDRAFGHAEDVIRTMRRRVLEDNGDVADGFLRGLSDKHVIDLDSQLEATIRAWMDQRGLQPNWVRFEAVSEHPVLPIAAAVRS